MLPSPNGGPIMRSSRLLLGVAAACAAATLSLADTGHHAGAAGLQQAQEEAGRRDVPVLLDFFTEW